MHQFPFYFTLKWLLISLLLPLTQSERGYPNRPLYMVLALPTYEHSIDPVVNHREMFLERVEPLVSEALKDVSDPDKYGLIPSTAIKLSVLDTILHPAKTVYKLMRLSARDRLDVIVGISNDYVIDAVSMLIPEWGWRDTGVPLISTAGQAHTLHDKNLLSTFTRAGGVWTTMAETVTVSLADHLGLTNVAFLLNDHHHDRRTMTNNLLWGDCYFKVLPIKLKLQEYTGTLNNDGHVFFNELNYTRTRLNDQLKLLSAKANVIILCASPNTVREIMLAAHELKMAQSGEYVFINIDVSTGSHAAKPWHREGRSDNAIALEAYAALKTISLRRSNEQAYEEFETRVKNQAELKYNYTNRTGQPYQMNNFISAFYDAVLLYAIALNETIADGGDPRNGSEITHRMWNRTFQGIAGNVSIDDNGDRYSDYSLLDLDPEKELFTEVAYYSGREKKLIEVGQYHWVKGKPPKDTPVCGFDRSLCPEGLPAWAWSLIGLAVVTILFSIVSFFIWRHYRLEAELAAMTWRIRWEELSGEERRKERRKNRGGTDWLLNGGAEQKDSGEQMDPLLDRCNSQNSVQEGARHNSIGHTSAGRKISLFIESRFRSRKNTDGNSTGNTKLSDATLGQDLPDAKSKSSKNSFASGAGNRVNAQKATIAEEEPLDDDKLIQPAVQRTNSSRLSRRDSWVSLKSNASEETIQFDPTAQLFTRTATYKGTMVAIKKLNITKTKVDLNRSMLLELKKMKDLAHDHITRFMGACIDAPHYCIVSEYCPKGSLEDILENENFDLDKMMIQSMIHDLVKGMDFIHKSDIKTHGNLKSSNCVVDSRFVLKVTDFGVHSLHAMEEPDENELEDSHAYWRRMLWTSPEHLREHGMRPHKDGGTQKGDVYSFSIILHEMLYRKGVWFVDNEKEPRDENKNMSMPSGPKEIVARICAPTDPDNAFRPSMPDTGHEDDQSEVLIGLMQKCWHETPAARPDFPNCRKIVRSLNRENETSNIVDNLLKRMEQYATNLEALVDERTSDYLEEKHKVENLLHQLLPPSVADTLIQGDVVKAESFDDVTIYFSDIVGFTAMSSSSTPMEVVHLLNDLYTAFDSCIADYAVYKVETIGDAYMCVSGLPERIGPERHAYEIGKMSIALLNRIKTFRIRHRPGEQLKLRIGIHSGSVCAGVVGLRMPRYCLFGDTVNTSSRMESNGLPLRIHVSNDTKQILATDPIFDLELRGEVEMKGKGLQTTWWLKSYGDLKVPEFPGYT